MTTHRYCDGLRRRDFLKVGALGLAGLGLADYLRLAHAGEANGKAKSAIFVYLGGGPARGGLDGQTVPGMIIRQVWVSQRPRPDFANR